MIFSNFRLTCHRTLFVLMFFSTTRKSWVKFAMQNLIFVSKRLYPLIMSVSHSWLRIFHMIMTRWQWTFSDYDWWWKVIESISNWKKKKMQSWENLIGRGQFSSKQITEIASESWPLEQSIFKDKKQLRLTLNTLTNNNWEFRKFDG